MRRTPAVVVALAALLGGAGAALSSSTEFELGAQLDGKQQVPKPPHPRRAATGSLTGDLDHQAREVTWKLVYAKLSGPATSAHLHRGKRGARGKIVLTLCAPTRRRCRSGITGRTVLPRATITALEAGTVYVDVHTRRNPRGEIRGQVTVKR
jgi:hypothetical protein